MFKTCHRLGFFLSFQVYVATYLTVLVCDLKVLVNIVAIFVVNSLHYNMIIVFLQQKGVACKGGHHKAGVLCKGSPRG